MNAPTKRDWTEKTTIQKRLRQLRRVLTIAYIVRREDHLTVAEIRDRLQTHFLIDVCYRTVSRDLNALIELGLVTRSRMGLFAHYHFIGEKLYEPGVISGLKG